MKPTCETAKHSPGPWRIADSSEIWANDQPVCTIADEENSNLDAETANANQRLIAAAPCMLAALQMALENGDDYEAEKAVRAAINKALGTP